MSKKPVMLCIMDGFGWTPNETYGNAVAAANKPFIDSLMAKYPMTTIDASGMAVGLPDGQMGNSEVGHTNMGAGRIVYQQLTLITKSIKDGEMLKNPVLVKNMKAAIDAGKAIHLMGLVGTGGVHSHADHWFGVLEMAKHMGAKEVYLHCITDGRDTDPHSGKGFLADLQAKLDALGIGKALADPQGHLGGQVEAAALPFGNDPAHERFALTAVVGESGVKVVDTRLSGSVQQLFGPYFVDAAIRQGGEAHTPVAQQRGGDVPPAAVFFCPITILHSHFSGGGLPAAPLP